MSLYGEPNQSLLRAVALAVTQAPGDDEPTSDAAPSTAVAPSSPPARASVHASVSMKPPAAAPVALTAPKVDVSALTAVVSKTNANRGLSPSSIYAARRNQVVAGGDEQQPGKTSILATAVSKTNASRG